MGCQHRIEVENRPAQTLPVDTEQPEQRVVPQGPTGRSSWTSQKKKKKKWEPP